MSVPDRLSVDRLCAGIQPALIGSEIVVIDQTPSTNDTIKEMADNGSPEGVVVFAEHQTAGRGQRASRWESAAHLGLWFSLLLRPQIDVRDSGRLTSWAARSVASTIERECGVLAAVKSPNDVMIENRKVAGVLVEMRAQPGAAHVAILGIGLNVNQAVADFPEELRHRATSLAIATGSRQDRTALAVALLRDLNDSYPNIVRLR